VDSDGKPESFMAMTKSTAPEAKESGALFPGTEQVNEASDESVPQRLRTEVKSHLRPASD
jgi:hypothetical protein